MTFCNLCAHYHVKQDDCVICYYPHFKKPLGDTMRMIVKNECPIYKMKGDGLLNKESHYFHKADKCSGGNQSPRNLSGLYSDKTCVQCGKLLGIRNKSGYCMGCGCEISVRKYQKKNREKLREYGKEWRKKQKANK